MVVMIGILGLTSSCIKAFKHIGKPDKDSAATLEIPQEVYIYDEYLKESPKINVLLLKDVKECNLAISSPFEIFSISIPLTTSSQSKVQINDGRKSIKKYNKLLKSRVALTNTHILIGNNKNKREKIV